jgi:hypothetical protein
MYSIFDNAVILGNKYGDNAVIMVAKRYTPRAFRLSRNIFCEKSVEGRTGSVLAVGVAG